MQKKSESSWKQVAPFLPNNSNIVWPWGQCWANTNKLAPVWFVLKREMKSKYCNILILLPEASVSTTLMLFMLYLWHFEDGALLCLFVMKLHFEDWVLLCLSGFCSRDSFCRIWSMPPFLPASPHKLLCQFISDDPFTSMAARNSYERLIAKPCPKRLSYSSLLKYECLPTSSARKHWD